MTALPLIGRLPAFLAGKLGFRDRRAESGEPAARLRPGGPMLLLRQPEDTRYVPEERPETFRKSPRVAGRGDLVEETQRRARAVIGRIVFGADYLGRDRELEAATVAGRRYRQLRLDHPILAHELLPLPAPLRHRAAFAVLDHNVNPAAPSLIAIMRESGFSDPEARDQAITLAVIAHGTIGEAVKWSLELEGAIPRPAGRVTLRLAAPMWAKITRRPR